MKAWILVLIAVLAIGLSFAQDITGDWNGMLEAGGQKIRIVFHIKTGETGLIATMDSPDQGVFDLPTRTVVFENSQLEVVMDAPPIAYQAEYRDGGFYGIFKQAGYEFPLDLQRKAMEKAVYNRPQEPKEPYPYYTEEVVFSNPGAGIKLAGTLSLPRKDGVFPTVVMITGSGAQNRDEELMGHKPFLVIADHLTRNGIAVLRFDDRGFGASEGDFGTATSVDFASDVNSAVQYLKTRPEIGKIGLMGHSEGGMIAPMVASQNPDVEFIVLLAGTGIRGDKILAWQTNAILKASGVTQEELDEVLPINQRIYEMVIAEADPEILSQNIEAYMDSLYTEGSLELPGGIAKDEFIEQTAASMTSPWMMYFIKYDPAPTLSKVKCPVLAVNGSKDLQVPPKMNLKAIKAALRKGGNKNVTTKEYPGLNHLFQKCKTGSPDEYAAIEQTFYPQVMKDFSKWIKKQVK